jgi:hypothetical protein
LTNKTPPFSFGILSCRKIFFVRALFHLVCPRRGSCEQGAHASRAPDLTC